ncbi:peptide chain release factor N(5)-glutamine methyltransferase [Brevibacillus humidisoli]|uniref:peptide chain release factor N(5)-glutamine methyltransferase n=1 Tax=Brevibacillus humidisoli TaxID=2895522 RepID=UPI001E6465EB|nr:peptide chain release factor N(5)-glutamine methyltransferase [Brevibacillus humidisoli]UFJ40192.1 peptide chain release factor N(5)-glutamine methyltransferase [Brevibacillus humidisoli]
MQAQPRKPETVREALVWASSFLRQTGSQDPRFEAELLLRHILGLDRTRFITALPETISAAEVEELERLCRRRAASEPLQYIVGTQEFFGRVFAVRPGVLIPRPETEILVEQVLRHADKLWPSVETLDAADIGTGSGAIALTLAAERPQWRVTTIDLSQAALAIAMENAERLHLSSRLRFLQGDLVQPLLAADEQVDLLVSNPPYIPSADVERLDPEVNQFEPHLALDGGDDGLTCYRKICAALPHLLRPTALVAFEVGIHQADTVQQLLLDSGAVDGTEIVPDLAGIDRVVLGWRREASEGSA